MKISATARIAPAIVLIATIGLNPAASASTIATLYTTTDLGSGYQLQTDSNGYTHDVTGADGSQTYAFDKSPVTSLYMQTVLPDGTFHYVTLQNGIHQVGYNIGYIYPAGLLLYPTFMSINGGWFTQPYGPYYNNSPIIDINSQGQVIGMSQYLLGQSSTFAAFSDPNGRAHSFADSAMNNLNNYITPIPGVNLTSAVKIDDLGRIIAVGSNGDDYLLTPVALGPVTPTPEPTAFAFLAVASAGFAIRRRLGRR